MRAVMITLLAACGSASPPPVTPVPVAPPPQLVTPDITCTEAAFGIDRAAKDLHPAEQEVVPAVRAQCKDNAWPQAAIECFAKLQPTDGLETCIGELKEGQRAPLVTELRGAQADETAELADVTAKLAVLSVGITSCDQFVAAVLQAMSCPGLAAGARIQLGTETAEAWSLPMHRLSIQDKARMAAACTESLGALQRHTADVACPL